jgi:hypothetical protein
MQRTGLRAAADAERQVHLEKVMERDHRAGLLIVDSMHAHTLKFATPLAPAYGDAVGIRILVAFLAVGIGIFFLATLWC